MPNESLIAIPEIIYPELPKPRFALLGEMMFETGTKEDWEALHELHYKSTSGTSGRYYKVTLHDDLIGICVMTSPRGLLAPRHELFPLLKPDGADTKITNTHRYKWLNKSSCLNSRTVVDTMFRGVGIAYRLLNLAARAEGKRFAEIQSSMSRYNLFAQRAGFRFTKPKQSQHYEAGLAFFRTHFRANPVDFLAVMTEFRAKRADEQLVLEQKAREFYFAHSALEKTGKNRSKGTTRVDAMQFAEVLKNLQQLVFAMPMYGVYENPDCGRALPKKFPLIWFDRQPTDSPLTLD